MTTTRTTIASWRALAVAGVILAGTCYVLFQDVLEGSAIGVGHVLTGLALLIATAAGHQVVPTFKDGRYALTLSMIVLAIGAITYIGIMSGARNAEGLRAKAERIEGANTQRVEILAERKRAQDMLDKARAAVADECKSGPGQRCKGRQATAEVYSAAVAGHDARLAALAPSQTANAGYKAAAEAIALTGLTSRSQAELERALIVLLPWLAVLLAELSVPAFLSLALGHAHVPTVADSAQTSFAPLEPVPPPGPGKRRKPRQLPATVTTRRLPTNVIPIAGNRSDIVAALEAIGRPATVSELARKMGVTRGEASRRWREAGNRVTAERRGKFVVIALCNAQAA